MDLGFVDLELQYLGDTTALLRLRDELVLPARKMGVSLWLAGISLGGMIALDYAATYPNDLDGLFLLSPYLGNRMLIAEIAAAPELGSWQPGPLADSDAERRIWRYLQPRADHAWPQCRTAPGGAGQSPLRAAAVQPRPRLHLGFGRDDRFAAAHRLLAQSLPADSVAIIDGGHDWPTWTRLWENFLDSHHL
jgi:pimeloyl-ACP methyl ester carboxylesterase